MKNVTIAVVLDGPTTNQQMMLESIEHEIKDLTRGEFNVQFPKDKQILGDWTLPGINKAIDKLLADRTVDIIITMGIIGSMDVCSRQLLPKPVIAPYILDTKLQDIPVNNGKSGIKNLNYVSVPATLERDLTIFYEVVPFHKLAIFINQALINSFPTITNRAETMVGEMGYKAQVVGVEHDIHAVMKQIDTDVDAVYVLPQPQLSQNEFSVLVTELKNRKLPSFSFIGESEVTEGILAGLYKDVISRTSRRVALNVQRILLGETPESIPVAISLKQQLTINEATSRAIGVFPSWAVMTEAEMVGREQREDQRKLTLRQAVDEAIVANLELAAQDQAVAAGEQTIKSAQANLLPSLNLSGTYVVIDDDLAKSSLGQQAERTLTGNVTATQIIYSEHAMANLAIQKKLQEKRTMDRAQIMLDVTKASATAYLNVLRMKTYERIQQENLTRTRQNIELARVREVIGSAGPAEVYRWESEIAINRSNVITVNAQRNLAEIELNRIRNRPAEESFSTQDVDLTDSMLITSKPKLYSYIENLQAFKIFRKFMVERAFKNSPELSGLDAAIAVQQRVLRSATNQFWSPTIALQGQFSSILSREGAGKDANFMVPPDIQSKLEEKLEITVPSIVSIPEPADKNWTLGLNLSFPLFEGGARFAARQQAQLELNQLQIQRDAVAERIEQRIRSAMHLAGASLASIKQARFASDAAHKSLEVVQNSYSQGLVNITVLLDAQYAALSTDLAAANSVYNFLIDLMEVERAVGGFTFFLTNKEREAFFHDIDTYFENCGMTFN
ncbi:TolC family protein [candidate division KSB1 bacterium]|nr:TolC family protein [candidate division KSB1 bacterium]